MDGYILVSGWRTQFTIFLFLFLFFVLVHFTLLLCCSCLCFMIRKKNTFHHMGFTGKNGFQNMQYLFLQLIVCWTLSCLMFTTSSFFFLFFFLNEVRTSSLLALIKKHQWGGEKKWKKKQLFPLHGSIGVAAVFQCRSEDLQGPNRAPGGSTANWEID